MKKVFALIVSILLVLGVSACKEETPKLSLDKSSATLEVGESCYIGIKAVGMYNPTFIYAVSNENVIDVKDGKITALNVGESDVTISVKDSTVESVKMHVRVIDSRKLEITANSDKVFEGKTLILNLKSSGNINLSAERVWKSSDESVATVSDGIVTGIKAGTATISVVIDGIKAEYKVTVEVEPEAIYLKISGALEVEEGSTIELSVQTNSKEEIKWSSSDELIATVENGKVTGIKEGTVVIKAMVEGVEDSITINVKKATPDLKTPEFVLSDGVAEKNFLNWNKEFDPMKGIKAIDDIDGDITANVKVDGTVDNKTYGFYNLVYTVSDKAGNIAAFERTIEVVWNYDVTFIGHAGSYYGLMNSEEAFLYAVQVLKYQALECDLKQTSDGVFVMSHNDTFGGYTIASTPWSVLKDVEVTDTRNSGYPGQNGSVTKPSYTAKLCTLERYLEICREYNAKAVIEVKSSPGITNSDQSRMPALMKAVEDAGMREDTILLGSQYNCLIWTRQNGYSDVECQYLVNSCESETYLERCKTYDLDISINVTGTASNSDEWLAKYKEAGLKISTYTFTQFVDYPEVQKWIDKGVDYVTCDWHVMSNLKLPESSKDPVTNITHTVIFKDYDGKVLKVAKVKDGRTAAAPTNPTRLGYNFIGWDKSIVNVKEDFEVTAQYEICHYSITYEKNLATIIKSSWESKEAFVGEFYGDLYNWFIENASYLKEFVKVDNGKVTITKNGVTVNFSNVNELIAIDIYDFEKTVSNFIYKPVSRNADGSCVIEHSEAYFLNSEKYRVKYQALDAWFYNCIKSAYPAYDDTYTPTSAGKIQIMFRFHQWAKGTSIVAFNNLPSKYIVKENTDVTAVLPTNPNSYTVEDEFDLPLASGSVKFLGWFLDRECTIEINKITKGMTGNIILYAKWEYTAPIVESNITFVLNDGYFEEGTEVPTKYEEGKELVLPTPLKDGYTFLGWTLTALDENYITVIPADLTGDVTLYANWKENIVVVEEIVVDPNGEYKTIADALKVATKNTRIIVKAGTYSEDLTINLDGITLIGPNNKLSGMNSNRKDEAVITGKITLEKGVKNISILGFKLAATTALYAIDENENINVSYNIIEGTADKAGSSSAGYGQLHFQGTSSNLVIEYNKFNLLSKFNYYSCVYTLGFVTNAEINYNYITNNCPTSQNVFGFWLKNAAGVININNNESYRFAGNYWTFWVGQTSLAENTKISINDNNFDSDSASNAQCGIAVHNAKYDSIEINYIGNTFSYTKDTIFSIQGASTADTTSKPHVKIMYNKILNTSARMRFCINDANFYFGKNYTAIAYSDQGTPNIKAAEAAKDDFKSPMELDEAYEETKMCAINYELDGGILGEGSPLKYQPGYALRLVDPVKDGYKFLGWSLVKGSKDYITIIPASQTGEITLYANWKEIKPALKVGPGLDYETIEAALAAATEGDTIELVAGTFKGATINKSVTIIGPNAFVNPSKETRAAEAIINSDLIIEANDVEINGVCLTGEARIVGSAAISIENLSVKYVLVDKSTVNGKDNAAYYFVPNDNVIYKNISITYSRTNAGSGRQMILYGYNLENLTISDCEFYGAYSTYNDGIKINNAGLFGVKGEVKITNNSFDGYQQYTIWLMSYGAGNYVIENNKFNNIGVADYHPALRMDSYVDTETYKVNVSFCFNTITKGYMFIRFEESKALTGDNTTVNVNYNLLINCSDAEFYIKNSNPSVKVNGDNNYYGTPNPSDSKFKNVTSHDNTYASPEDVPTIDEIRGGGEVEKIYSKINYVLNGGEVIAASRYLEGVGYVLPIPTKVDFKFIGWSLTEGGTEYITEISKDMKGDVTVYANWEEIEFFKITYVFNGGYSNESIFENRGDAPHFDINNFNYNNGTFWSGRYTTDIFIGDPGSDPGATFSDRIYIAKNKDTGLYEILDIIATGGSKWAEGAEYVITISNSYGGYYANINPITRNLKKGFHVVFSGDFTTASADNPITVCFFETLPKGAEEVTVKVSTVDSLLVPGNLGFTFLGWFDKDGKKYNSIDDIKESITLYAKWEAVNPVTSILVEDICDELFTGQKYQIKAKVQPDDAYFQQLYYTSSNTDILQVSTTGELTAINEGKATITITDYMGYFKFEKEIVVYSLDTIDATFEDGYIGVLKPNEVVQLFVKAYGKDVSKVTFKFTSLNTDIATVSETGLITAVKDGYVDILITAVGIDANLTIGVNVKTLSNDTEIDKLLSLLVMSNFPVVETGNVSLYNDGRKKVFVPVYGSVNRYLFDKFTVDETYYANTEKNPNNHQNRRSTDQIEFVTVHDTATLTGTVVSIAQGMSSGETSIHYTVGNDAIYGVVPEKYIAYHAGDGTRVAFTWTKTDAKATGNVAPEFDIAQAGGSYYLTVNGVLTSVAIPKVDNLVPTKDLLTRLGPVWKVENGYYYVGGPLWYSEYGRFGSKGGNNNSIGIEMCVNTSGDIYDTWQRTAQLVADILIRNNLDTTRVKQHNTWSGKNCPQCLIEGGYWPEFMKMVELQYEIQKNYKDATISIQSNNPELVDNTGRVISHPEKTTTVTYTLTVELNGETRKITLSNVIPGTTTWEQWDGTYSASTVWNNGYFAR